MPKITKFTLNQFLDIDAEYTDMMVDIETRAFEIAVAFGEVNYKEWQINEVNIGSMSSKVIATAKFINRNDKSEKFFSILADWLFNDNYKTELEKRNDEEKVKEAREWQEYLRLRKKYEGF